MEWINDQFGGYEGTQGISTHVLPPNMSVVELSNIAYGDEYEVLKAHYRDSVYTFFGLSNQSTVQVANKSVSEFISSEQHINTRNVINFLESVLQKVYTITLHVELATHGQSRAIRNNTDDIKKGRPLGESSLRFTWSTFDSKEGREEGGEGERG